MKTIIFKFIPQIEHKQKFELIKYIQEWQETIQVSPVYKSSNADNNKVFYILLEDQANTDNIIQKLSLINGIEYAYLPSKRGYL